MMTAAQVQAVKMDLLAAQVSYKRSELNEQSLYVELHNFFQRLKETVLHELREYWVDDDDAILLNGHLDLILAPIFESQQKYYNILRKHNIKEYNFGCKEASRLVKLSRKSVSSLKAESNTTNTNKLLNIGLEKDELFGTNDWTQQRLLNQSFTASENTMNRVDQDINKIISDGYKSGAGVNKVAANIETRFEQLKTWESKRIARTEMHNAHQMGIMNTYQEMGVEYTQWSSAHDSRVRGLKPKDKADHVKMDGEIIPLGGTYSNGLQYPGDTKGPIYEWINCRCGNVPFIMPDGYIAPPGMAQFREEDLIQTLDYWNQDDLIKQATQEASQIPEGKILEEIKRTNGFDIYRLPSGQREHYLKLKKNHDILKEALETKNYNKLDQLDHSAATMIESKATVKELGDDFLELAKEELEDYTLDILEYEKIIKDKNIKVTIEPKGIKWKNETLKDYLIHNSKTGKYEPFNANEKFIKYHFKKENLTILESVDMDTSRVMHVYNEYKKLPKRLQNTNEIVLSSQQPIKTVLGFDDAKLGGYVIKGKGSRIVEFKKTLNETIDTIVHEATHNLEKDQLYYISNSKEYVLAFKKDQQRLLSQGKTLKETYVTDYAYSFTEAALESNTAANRAYGHRIYSEDLAESMKKYLRNKKAFAEDYPEKAKVLEKILNGKFKPKTTTPYHNWLKIEENRFKLTPKEIKRNQELKWKQTDLALEGKKLSSKELKELEFYKDKTTFDYLYNKKIKGELLDNAEEKAFKDISKKWKRKLKLPKENILELSKTVTDENIRKKLSQLSEKELMKQLYKTLDKGQRIRYSELMKTLKSTVPSSKVYKEIKAQMFEYEKLLFKPKNPVPKIDRDLFLLDNQNIGQARTIVGTILEKKQIELQEKIILTWKELHAVKSYGGISHRWINGYIRKNDDWADYLEDQLRKGRTEKDILNEIEDLIEDLDSAMEKTTGLAQDSTIFRACDTFSGTLRPGDISSFEGYGSCSFQEESAKGFMDDGRYKLKILAPKGQKGIAMNAKNDGVRLTSTSNTHEHEFLLPKNQKFQVLEVDHFKHEATILLI